MNSIIQNIDYKIDLFALFMFLGIGQGLFLSFIFLFKKGNKNKTDSYMGLLLVFFSLIIIEHFLDYTKYIINVIYLFSFANSLPFIIAPLFFFFIYTHLYGNTIKWKFAHFIPFALYFIYYFITFNIQSNDVKLNAYIYSYNPDLQPVKKTHLIYLLPANLLRLQQYYDHALITQFGVYLIAEIFYLLKCIKGKKLNYFIIKDNDIKWLRNVITLSLFIFIVLIYIKIVIKRSSYNYLVSASITCLIYYISFSYIWNSSFFNNKGANSPFQSKYAKSPLSDEEKQNILMQINLLMKDEKPFKKNLFSLPILAKKIGVIPNHVSQVINECLNQNFYTFLATYRINEAKKLLASEKYKNLTIEQIAYEVGYNSKSAFNSSFKKHCGQNPSQYRKQLP